MTHDNHMRDTQINQSIGYYWLSHDCERLGRDTLRCETVNTSISQHTPPYPKVSILCNVMGSENE